MLTPFERYQEALSTGNYEPDENQAIVIKHFQTLHQSFTQQSQKAWFKKPAKISGLYIWGSVGTGKTWLMDLFFESLPLKKKWRIHFHDFMHQTHDALTRYQGTEDPLKKIAAEYAKNTKVLCFDELIVNDIGDAMILGRLFEALFKENIVIVATSNVPPDDLYKDGLQRARFLPAISFIKKNMHVIHLPTVRDYRLRALEKAGVFFYHASHEQMKERFLALAENDIKWGKDLYLYDRPLSTIAYATSIIWFDFKKLCQVPRSQVDYLSITKRFKTVILDNLQTIAEKDTNIARYFINLIDILYDTKTILILNSNTPLEKLYTKGELSFEFKRTLSRLTEMQSTAYLEQAGTT